MRERLEAWVDYIGGTGLAFLAVSGILFLLGQPRERVLVIFALAVILLVIYVFVRPQQVRELVTGRSVRYGSNALLFAVAFIGLIALLNYLSGRYNWRYDLTANKTETLSDLTITAMRELKDPIQATVFYSPQNPGFKLEAEERLKDYARYSDKFTSRYIDREVSPQIANDYKVQFDVIVLERGSRRENVFNIDESSLTNAILKASQDKQPVVYFTTGHGEHSPEDTGDSGYSSVKQGAEALNYKMDLLNLRTVTDTLPSDISSLVIAGPRQKFDADEAQRIKDYLDNHGRVLVMLDPEADSGLDSLLNAWGVNPRNDMVIDPTSSASGRPNLLVVAAFKGHAVTQDLGGFAIYVPTARSFSTTSGGATGRTATSLFASSSNAWGETDFAALRNQTTKFDVNVDAKGPLDLAYAVEASGDNPGRLVVVGNSSFIANSTLGSYPQFVNGILFGNILRWLASEENLIAIPPKPTASNPLILSADMAQFVFVTSTFVLPGAILLIGALIWWRRR